MARGLLAGAFMSLRRSPLLPFFFLGAAACTGGAVGVTAESEPSGSTASPIARATVIPTSTTSTNAPPDPPSLDQLVATYSGYDKNNDGIVEINQLTKGSADDGRAPGANGMVLAIVEKRIVAGGNPTSLKSRLATWRDDLALEGFGARFVEADLYAGSVHQDGRTLLALRDFVKAVRASYPSLKGVFLVGHFPEAALVQRAMHAYPTTQVNGVDTDDVLGLSINRINPRSDLVLGDMDGRWESLYHQASTQIPRWKVKVENTSQAWPAANSWYASTTYESDYATWEDYFELREDVTWTAGPQADANGNMRLNVYVGQTEPDNPEVTTADAALPNPMARPELFVSRVDAKTVAWQPTVTKTDLDGKGPLDATGKPQTLRYAAIGAPGSILWVTDIAYEQRLLSDYFLRNHDFRHYASLRPPWRVSSIRSEEAQSLTKPVDFDVMLERAGTGWGTAIPVDHADLTTFADWFAMPSLLKMIIAHSAPKYSQVPTPADLAALESAVGAPAFAWRRQSLNGEVTFTPDYAQLPRDQLAFQYLRSVLAGGRTASSMGTFYFHEGCDVTNPGNETETMQWSDAYYGRWSIGDATMLFGNGLSLYGRAKVYNDRTDDFLAGLAGSTATLGNGWRNHFDADAANAGLRTNEFAHKKVYFWNLYGDWTLRIKY